MNQTLLSGCLTGGPTAAPGDFEPSPPQLALLDMFFPGFSTLSGLLTRYTGVDLNVYVPAVILLGAMIFSWTYVSEYFRALVSKHLMSTVEIRVDDEIYNIIMAWVAEQKFAKASRSFVVNTNLTSRSWFLWKWTDDEDTDESDDGELSIEHHRKALSYTPAFGSHTFWYRRRLLLFRRIENREQVTFGAVSEREQISISCFGRSPWILKELLLDAKMGYTKKDMRKTQIYRGTCKGASSEPHWQRSMSRVSRPLSTVILGEATKKKVLEDMADYLRPSTRRWYANRGIPYRRGYLLYGPPGTGKSSLSLALAGHFNMRIYIVSLNSISANEENLSSLFAELPRRCVVLLEDIDTAGLTNTREEVVPAAEETKAPIQPPVANPLVGRLSLSALLNILDGVASQEGRILIMTTNHLEKLDKALIRPGRVDMTIEFGRADHEISASIFTAIFATLEADDAEAAASKTDDFTDEKAKAKAAAAAAASKDVSDGLVCSLARDFAAKVPEHEFSPAEIQGYLLPHKRSPADAVANVEAWVADMRKQRKEKELKEAEDKRKEAEEEAEKKRKEAEKEQSEKDKKETAGAGAGDQKADGSERAPGDGANVAACSGDEAASAQETKAAAKAVPAHSVDAISVDGTGCMCRARSGSSTTSESSVSQPPTPSETSPAPATVATSSKEVAAGVAGEVGVEIMA